MATTGMTQVTSSSSRGVEFYFQIAALLIGVLGTAANALVLYALAEMTMGQRVTGQVGQQIWVGHVGHVSVLVTRWPMIKLTRFQEQANEPVTN